MPRLTSRTSDYLCPKEEGAAGRYAMLSHVLGHVCAAPLSQPHDKSHTPPLHGKVRLTKNILVLYDEAVVSRPSAVEQTSHNDDRSSGHASCTRDCTGQHAAGVCSGYSWHVFRTLQLSRWDAPGDTMMIDQGLRLDKTASSIQCNITRKHDDEPSMRGASNCSADAI